MAQMKRYKETYMETCRKQAGGLKLKIMSLLGWDELQYGECQYENGLKYVEPIKSADPDLMDQVLRNKMFWNWWKNHWTVRDEIFIKMTRMVKLDRDELTRLYHQFHDGAELQKQLTLHGVILYEAYADMITDLIAEETNNYE